MKTASVFLAPLLLAAGTLAQSSSDDGITLSGPTCNGDDYVMDNDGYCCVNGEFSGPVIASMNSRESSQEASESSFQSSLQNSLSSMFSNSGIQTSAAAQITAAPMLKRGGLVGRAITTEFTSGLTCIGDSVSSYAANSLSVVGSSSTGDASTTGSMTSSASAGSANSSSSSTGGMPMITPGPVMAIGAAVAAFAYGAM